MFKKYIINQLTQLSAWLGAATILAALFLPRSFIIFLGILMILTDDEKIKKMTVDASPAVKDFLDK